MLRGSASKADAEIYSETRILKKIKLWSPGVKQFVKWSEDQGNIIRTDASKYKFRRRWCKLTDFRPHMRRQQDRTHSLRPNVMNELPAQVQCQRLPY